MGIVKGIGYDEWPKQGANLGREVRVCFRYDASRTLRGTVIRDDIEEPFRTIIRLDDGRVLLASECQFSIGASVGPTIPDPTGSAGETP